MRISVSLFICLGYIYCFALINPDGYIHRNKIDPNFVALAVLESQNCPPPIVIQRGGYKEIKRICKSRYRIISLLEAASDFIKKEYIEIEERPRHPYYKHRPMLISGKYENGTIQFIEHEETREYFCGSCIQYQTFRPFASEWFEGVYALHSIGTSYFNINDLDSLDKIFYNEYLIPYTKHKLKAVGKNFGELLLRLIQRTPIRMTKIKNEFVAFGTIKNLHYASDPKQASFYELNIAVGAILKNDAKIDSSVSIFIDRGRLPSGWSCQPLEHYLASKVPFYFLGSLRDGNLFLDSLISPQDAFVFGDTIYDISMGLPFEELVAYFFPLGISLEEFKFGSRWERLLEGGTGPERIEMMGVMPECLRNAIEETSIKWNEFLDNKRLGEKFNLRPFLDFIPIFGETGLYCRAINCCKSDLKNDGIWGRTPTTHSIP